MYECRCGDACKATSLKFYVQSTLNGTFYQVQRIDGYESYVIANVRLVLLRQVDLNQPPLSPDILGALNPNSPPDTRNDQVGTASC